MLEAEKNENRRCHVRIEESRKKEKRWKHYDIEIFEPVLDIIIVGRLFFFGGSVTSDWVDDAPEQQSAKKKDKQRWIQIS